jgi:hypothetical protein
VTRSSPAGTARRGWTHPLAPAPLLVVAAVAVATTGAPVLVAWVVLALSAGYAISGSV